MTISHSQWRGEGMSTSERRAREKEQRKQDILEAARKVFSSKGIGEATVEDVAAAAELSKGTIYLYFSSKEEILAHLLLEGFDILLEKLAEAYVPQQNLSPTERLYRLTGAYLQFFKENPFYFRLMVAFDRGRLHEKIPSELGEEIKTKNQEALQWVAKAIKEGIQRELFRPCDPWLTAAVLWASIHGVIVLMSIPFRRELLGFSLEKMAEAALALLLKGLENPDKKEET
ncbi:MAG: TetR/AcrR family transcriptional regulator [Anaerolineae bacterium]|nr:TetR/AcrR family transcriptional regulator [Anaerolineae bacterium]